MEFRKCMFTIQIRRFVTKATQVKAKPSLCTTGRRTAQWRLSSTHS